MILLYIILLFTREPETRITSHHQRAGTLPPDPCRPRRRRASDLGHRRTALHDRAAARPVPILPGGAASNRRRRRLLIGGRRLSRGILLRTILGIGREKCGKDLIDHGLR